MLRLCYIPPNHDRIISGWQSPKIIDNASEPILAELELKGKIRPKFLSKKVEIILDKDPIDNHLIPEILP